jgi:hypothetical protein
VIAAGLALAGLAFEAAPAQAVFHLMKIREVYLGSSGAGNNDAFIELQMFAAGQNQVGGHDVDYYNATGGLAGSVPIDNDVPNGDNQRTILIGDTAVPGRDVANVSADALGEGISVYRSGGAVCFAQNIDCVSWGSFSGSLPSPNGAPGPAMPDGSSLERSIAPNCPTLLEDADDTNDSATDFALATPSPRNNATAPTEAACGSGGGGAGGPDTQITKKPKNKVKKKRVTYAFTSSVAGATFQCSENGKPFHSCASPHTFKAKKGRNEFEVRAVDAVGNVDQTPAEDKFKRKKRKK